jgi:parallel beta-helix repeat protein
MFQDMSDEFGTGATDTGCRIQLKNGLYEIDQGTATQSLVEWGNVAEGDHVHFHIEGETRDGVIIRNVSSTGTNWRMFLARCNITLNNLTMDGANLGPSISLVEAYGQSNGDIILEARNCRFMRSTAFCNRTGDPTAGMICHHNIYEQPAAGQDQIAIGVTKFATIMDNYMDRTNGTYVLDGSSITAGGGNHIRISGNLIKRNPGYHSFGISIEGFEDYDGVMIDHNIVENGWINIDVSDAAYTSRRIKVIGNDVFQGGIRVLGPPSSPTNAKYITVENNTIIDSDLFGIKIADTGGRSTVKNNLIVNSNRLLMANASSIDIGLIRIVDVSDLEVTDNTLEMNVTSPANADYCWYGIRYESLTNCRIKRNEIINNTLANSSYSSVGTSTGCEISKEV